MKFIDFHLGYSNIQNFTRSELLESIINPSIEPMLNNLSDVQELEIVGDVDVHNPDQNVTFHEVSIATKNSILGKCMMEYKNLVSRNNLQGSDADRRRTILSSFNINSRYRDYLTELCQAIGYGISYNI
jgi:hypothetical protein